MNFLDTIKDKFTMLQDEFDGEGDVDAADNSEAPDEPEAPPAPPADAPAEAGEPDVEEKADDGTTDTPDAPPKAEPKEDHSSEDCDVTFFGSCEYFTYWQLSLQVANVTAFFFTVVINFSSQYFMPESLADVTAYWNLPVDPAGWAFSIWGVIYTLLGFFTFYQMLPSGWIEYLGGKRNDDMIFNKMNLIFVFNMLCNAAWLPIFQSNTQWGFIVGWVLIVGIWMSNTALMVISQRYETWWLEVLAVRLPFSIYSGWVTGATILNTLYMLKSLGMSDKKIIDPTKNGGAGWLDILKPLMFLSEEDWTIITLWMVECFFEVISWWERNPVWGSVFTWASSAILNKNLDKMDALEKAGKDSNFMLVANVGCIIVIHAFSQGLLFIYLIFEQLQPWYLPFTYWQGGILGLTDWSLMFKQFKQLLTYPEEYLMSLTEREMIM